MTLTLRQLNCPHDLTDAQIRAEAKRLIHGRDGKTPADVIVMQEAERAHHVIGNVRGYSWHVGRDPHLPILVRDGLPVARMINRKAYPDTPVGKWGAGPSTLKAGWDCGVVLDLVDGELPIVNVHMAPSVTRPVHDPAERRARDERRKLWDREAANIVTMLAGYDRAVAAGDTNCPPGYEGMKAFRRGGFHDHQPGITHPPKGRIDHTLARGIGVVSQTKWPRKFSDHCPVETVLLVAAEPKPAPKPPEEPVTEHSYNGWPASRNRDAIHIVPLTVAGVSFVPGVRAGDVHTVLGHVAQQFNDRVEKLVSPGCWGYSYRQNRNANNLSCHSSGTAIDCNAPQHPNGFEASQNYSSKQIAEIHKILAEIPELSEAVHWGGDWHRSAGLTPDPMHFEIHDHDTAKLARVAARIRNKSEEDDMPAPKDIWEGKDVADEIPAPKVGGEFVPGYSTKNPGAAPRHAVGRTWQNTVVILGLLRSLADTDALADKIAARVNVTGASAEALKKAVQDGIREMVEDDS